MERHRIIGGEFELSTETYEASRRYKDVLDYPTYATGRIALLEILKNVIGGG
jgi:tRNA 2-selenouridine synthase SelU